MPLQSAHVFASHIGHTGKTTLCFHMSCLFAKQNPDTSVLVIDFAEEGDLTKRLLGGVDTAKAKADEIYGGIFRLMSAADTGRRGITSWLSSGVDLDITKHAILVSEHNPSVPANLHLISSGAWPKSDPELEKEARDRMASNILQSLKNSGTNWKMFCDTDGDRRPSSLTKLAYCLCSQAIVPLHLSKADLDRTETMLGCLHELRMAGEIKIQVLAVVWNMVKVLKDEPCTHTGRLAEAGVELPFTPTKVSLDILDACNARLYDAAQQLPGLFVHGDAGEAGFVVQSTLVQRQLADNVLKPSEELGMPFVRMVEDMVSSGRKSVKFKTGGVEYEAKDSLVQSVDSSIQALASKLEAMAISG